MKETPSEIYPSQKANLSLMGHPPDSANYAAQKIIDDIESGKAEIFAHDWLKQRARGNQQETTDATYSKLVL